MYGYGDNTVFVLTILYFRYKNVRNITFQHTFLDETFIAFFYGLSPLQKPYQIFINAYSKYKRFYRTTHFVFINKQSIFALFSWFDLRPQVTKRTGSFYKCVKIPFIRIFLAAFTSLPIFFLQFLHSYTLDKPGVYIEPQKLQVCVVKCSFVS